MEEDKVTWYDLTTIVEGIRDSIRELKCTLADMTPLQKEVVSDYIEDFDDAQKAAEMLCDDIDEMEGDDD